MILATSLNTRTHTTLTGAVAEPLLTRTALAIQRLQGWRDGQPKAIAFGRTVNLSKLRQLLRPHIPPVTQHPQCLDERLVDFSPSIEPGREHTNDYPRPIIELRLSSKATLPSASQT